MTTTVWFNPRCSKCQGAEALLREHGVEATYVHYLDEPPTREQIEEVLRKLGTDDPHDLARKGEPAYSGLESASRDELIEAMTRTPVLIERPVVITDTTAVIARPPEKLLEILGGAP